MAVPARESRSERDVARNRYITRALQQAARAERSLRCRESGEHDRCRGEGPENGTVRCLCTCHDDARDAEASVST